MSDVPLIALDGVRYTYPGASVPVLDDAAFSLHAGQRIGLLGPNGSGKTTLVHVMMGLLVPERGRVLFKGREVAGETAFGPVRAAIGLLLQNADDQLFFPTVLDDVAFGPLNIGQPPAQARETALGVLASLGLGGFENRLTHRLSGGEKKLVALAAVLAMNPQALLLDEPTNNLDPATREKLIAILRSMDRAMVIISHDWDFLAKTTDDFCSIKNGRVCAESNPAAHVHVHIHPSGDVHHDHSDA